MKKNIFLILFFSLSSSAHMTLEEYAEIRFDFDFAKMDKPTLIFIMRKCHSVGRFAEEIGMTSAKEIELEFGVGMLETYQETRPNLSQDERIELLNQEAYPLYVEYHLYWKKNKEDPDLIISDLAFCDILLDTF